MSRALDLLTRPLPTLLLLALLSTLIYSNTFSAVFHFDDTPNIEENSRIKNLADLFDLSGSRYIGFLSFALNYHFGRLNVFGYHLVNLLIHITNGFLVYTLVRLLFRASNSSEASRPTTAPWIALAAALLFVAHPIQTQAVTYIVQRFASLATLFYLLTVVFYLQWRLSPPDTRSRYFWYAGALIATILAMKTKEITFTLPFMLLLVEAVFFAPLLRKHWIGLIPFLLTLPIIPLSRPGALGEGEAGFARDITDISRWDYLLTQFRVIVTYLRLLIFPVHQNLDYDYPIYHSFLEPPVFFSFLFLLSLFGLAIYLLFSSCFTSSVPRLMAFGILWFFLTLSVESSIIPIRDVIFEHRIYLPSMGILLVVSVAMGWGLSHLHTYYQKLFVGILLSGTLVTILSIATYQRNKVWEDATSLWTDVISKSPGKARGHNNLGEIYYKQGRLVDATVEIEKALQLNPDSVSTHNNLGLVYYEQGKFEKAGREFLTALKSNAHALKPHLNLALTYVKIGHIEEALRENNTGLQLEPDNVDVYNNLGMVYHESGRLREAVTAYQTALRLNPMNAMVHNNLGAAYAGLGQLEESIQEYQTALMLNPDYVNAHYNIGLAYIKLGKMEEARRHYTQALHLRPNFEAARKELDALP